MSSSLLFFLLLLAISTRTLASDDGGTVWSIAKGLAGITADNTGANQRRAPSLRLIGAGFGRTGTTSIKAALEMLEYAPVHHGSAVFDNNLFSNWAAILNEEDKVIRQRRLREIMDGYQFQATLDFPACLVYQDLMVNWRKCHRLKELSESYSVIGEGSAV